MLTSQILARIQKKSELTQLMGYETLQNVNAESPIRISLRMCSFIGYSQTT